jgi:hypothetical protein
MLTEKEINSKLVALENALKSPDAQRIKMMAKQFGLAKMIPDSVKTSLVSFIQTGSSFTSSDPVAVSYVKAASKAIAGVCDILGIQ